MRATALPTAALLVVSLLALTGCAGAGKFFGLEPRVAGSGVPSGRLDATSAAAQREAIEQDLAAGRPRDAIERSLLLRRDAILEPEDRNQVEQLLERSVRAFVDNAERPKDLDNLRASRLPRLPRAILAVGRAREFLAADRPFEGYLEILDLERDHPSHPLQQDVASVLYDSGIALANSNRKRLGLFPERNRAPIVLDYLVLQHPTYPGCDHAYFVLAELLSDSRDLQRAIDRLSELLLYHPGSPYALQAESLVPRLRLADHLRPDYDRAAVDLARRELENWLSRHGEAPEGSAAAELEPSVRESLALALSRLGESDRRVAEFYLTIERPEGARLHAERSLALAQGSGDEDLIAASEAALNRAAELEARLQAGSLDARPELLGSAADAARESQNADAQVDGVREPELENRGPGAPKPKPKDKPGPELPAEDPPAPPSGP